MRFVTSKEHSAYLRAWLNANLSGKWYVRKDVYGNLEVSTTNPFVSREKMYNLLNEWRTGTMGHFDNYIHFEMWLTKERFPRILNKAAFECAGVEGEKVSVSVQYISFN